MTACAFFQASRTEAQTEDAVTLQPGDPVPALKTGEWLKGEPVTEFEAGKTYVVEFWATWCGPCKRAMPHLSALARQYRGRVPFVSVNVWEKSGSDSKITDAEALKQVTGFVKGAGERMDYTVAMDDAQETMGKTWMKAAGVNGIPSAFIVHDRKVAWIGHPQKMDKPLEQVLTGGYDPRTALLERQQNKADSEEANRLWKYPALEEARKRKDYPALIRIFEQAIAMNPRLERNAYVSVNGLFAALLHADPAKAAVYAREFMQKQASQNEDVEFQTFFLGFFASTILNEKDLPQRDLDLALEFAQKALALTPVKRAPDYASVAEVHFARGERELAIALQQLAVVEAEKTPAYDPYRKKIVQRYRSKLDEYQKKAG